LIRAGATAARGEGERERERDIPRKAPDHPMKQVSAPADPGSENGAAP
jgi:hypothetical protein